MNRYALGLDFGTSSVRALIVDPASGSEVASATCDYAHGVMTGALPTGAPLGVDWALQDPADYENSMSAAIRQALEAGKIDKREIIGIGIDFTASSPLPVMRDSTPLCALEEYRNEPHAYVKLWMDHSAAAQAERINRIAQELAAPWIRRYSNRLSAEFLLPKLLKIADEAPELYRKFDLFVEAGDWIVWRMTGNLCRNACAAGYKALWHSSDGYPGKPFYRALNPIIESAVEDKLAGPVLPMGSVAGVLTSAYADRIGLMPGTPVGIDMVDGHCAFLSLGIAEPGTMMIIMGTSGCHFTVSDLDITVPGMCGAVRDGILPGLIAYESGQSGFGSHIEWFLKSVVPSALHQEAVQRGLSDIDLLTSKIGGYRPGQSGLIALDWWNGNRSTLNNQNLSGLLVGLTYQTMPEDILHAILESMAFGTRRIVESYEQSGIPIHDIVVGGGIPYKNPYLIQLCSDILGKPIRLVGTTHDAALGAAMLGAAAAGREAGGYSSLGDAVHAMGRLGDTVYAPSAERHADYESVYADYCALYDAFGKDDMMKRLKERRQSV